MAIKRGTNATKRGKASKSLPVKGLTPGKAQGVRGGGKGKLFEVEDYSFDVEQVLNIGSASSGAGAGKVSFNDLKPKGK